jgi:hypothetical protein
MRRVQQRYNHKSTKENRRQKKSLDDDVIRPSPKKEESRYNNDKIGQTPKQETDLFDELLWESLGLIASLASFRTTA